VAFPANIDVVSLDGLNGTRLEGTLYDASGASVASAGDINGDGFDDVIINAAGGYGTYINNPGGSYVVFGKAGGLGALVELSGLDGSDGFKLSGSGYGVQSVASAGDVNGDGYDDLILGAPSDGVGGANNGVSYVVFGKASGFAADIHLSTLNGANGFALNGVALGNEAGWSVASAGDVNNDGYDDLIIGATSAGTPGVWQGASYVVFGKAAGFSASMNLSSLNGTNGFAIVGGKANDEGGWSVASAGDVNGDGYDDVIVGARSADPNGDQSGASYVVFGKGSGFASTLNISTLNGTNGFKLSGGAISDFSGFSVSSAGDINGDGFADLIVGAPGVSLNGSGSGASYVVFGKASGFTANLNLSTLTGSNGFRIVGAPASDGQSIGYSVASAGDFNGDGYDDLIIGAMGDDSRSQNSGASYVLFGKAAGFGASFDLSTVNGANGFKVIGAGGWDMTGWSVASAGDVNNDGYDDLIIGAPQHIAGLPGEGRSYVIYGHAGALGTDQPPPSLAYLDASNGFKLSGAASNDYAGRSVASAGDINGDGFDDVIVGAWRADAGAADAGASYVVFGKAGGFLSDIQLSALNGSDGFKLSGVAADDRSGYSVASAGDVNGDGYDDLIVGAALADPNGNSSGASYIVFGKASGFTANFSLSTLNGSNGFKLSGGAASDKSGFSVASAGDFNGDGFDDLIVGAPGAKVGSAYGAGSAYIVYGKASGFAANFSLSSLSGGNGFKLTGVVGADAAGTSVAAAGDVNGDGYDDVIVGAPWTGGTGGSYVVFGKAAGFGASFALSTLNGSNGFKLSGVAASDGGGISVASAGDVNGDGFADLIVGSPNADPHGTSSGTSYVVFGKASGFAANIDLSTLNGSNGFRLTGVAANDSSGVSVSSAGDFNGDGIDDLVIGAVRADTNGIDAGTTYVIFGRTSGFSAEIDLSSLDASAGFALKGGRSGDWSGGSVASAGDVNGDGYDDLIIGAERGMPNGISSGAAYVVFGGAFGGTVTTSGTAAAEMLIGGAANDVLTGGGGGDAFHAGAGNDRLVVADLTFRLADGGGGTDTLALSGAGLTLDLSNVLVAAKLESIERIDLTGSGDNTLIVNQRAVLGGVGAEAAGGKHILVVERNAGDVVQFVEAGWTKTGSVTNADGTFDRWVLGNAEVHVEQVAPTTGAVIVGTAGNDVISTTVTVPGQPLATDLADTIDGGAGDDVLDSGGGNDALYGGADNDTLIGGAATAGGTNQLWGGTGSDTASYAGTTGAVHADLAAQVAYIDGVLVDQMNSIENLIGGSGDDVLTGDAGANVLAGKLGNDTYVIGAGDTVVEAAGEGTDTVRASIDYTLGANLENLVLIGMANLSGTGNGLVNVLTGNAGHNLLDGGAGADTMVGGLGDDTYVVGSVADLVVEEMGAGTDTVLSSITYTLTANVENLELTGTDAINGTGNALDNWLTGNAAVNILSGGLGKDTYLIDSLDDTIVEVAGEGTDTVRASIDYTLGSNLENLVLTGTANLNGTGNGLVNILTGNAGDNLLDGGAGADTMAGGLGNDTYVIGAGDVILEAAGEGTDTVRSSISYTLTANVEELVLIGIGTLSGTGNALANNLIGGDGLNVLDGGEGADTMAGRLGNDTYVVDDLGDVVVEAANEGVDTVRAWVDHTLTANVEKIVLQGTAHLKGTGNALDNGLTGNAGNNLLDGGTGADTMVGGLGDDTYIVDNAGDVASEEADAGLDTVRSSVSLRLRSHVENLALAGSDGINGTGNDLANVLTGNAGNNVLDGGVGDDTMAGGVGDDTYVMDVATDKITELVGQGMDTVQASFTYVLRTNFENLTLTGSSAISAVGNAVDNVLIGNAGANALDGRAGADTMQGGAGDDTYYVENAGDVVIEVAGKGADAVKAWLDYTLSEHVEKLVLQGTDDLNGTGNSLDNTLVGNAGNNVLDGGAGADSMSGEEGDDTFFIDNAGDRASEDAGEGFDTLFSSLSYVLRPNLEKLVLTGTADINGVGNAENNTLDGNDGGNTLDGRAGADTMTGGLGDDKYVVDSAGDVVVELADQGIDSVRSWISYTLGGNLEKLTLYGAANLDGAGNDLINTVIGNSGRNILDGGLGSDTLSGEGGGDTFRFSTALGTSNVDKILVFDHAADTIQLDDAIFAALGTGALGAGAFNTGTVATQADDRILFDTASKSLYYDADGVGGVAAIRFATIATLTGTLDHTDFFVV
jgi:Ca2+-binding RTX toxin-like protein